MKYTITTNIYNILYEDDFRCEIFEEKSDLEALLRIEQIYSYGQSKDEDISKYSVGKVRKMIEVNNGDETDFVISVVNLTTEEIIFSTRRLNELPLERGRNLGHSEYKCSKCGKVLSKWYWYVTEANDEEGHRWRGFCDECWNKVGKMEDRDIYNTFNTCECITDK